MARYLSWGRGSATAGDAWICQLVCNSIAVFGSTSDGEANGNPIHVLASGNVGADVGWGVSNREGKIWIVELDMAGVRSKLGVSPIVLHAVFRARPMNASDVGTFVVPVRRVFADISAITDISSRYKSVSGSVPWADDAYAPLPGVDVEDADYSQASVTISIKADWADYPGGLDDTVNFEITDIVQEALQFNQDKMRFALWKTTSKVDWVHFGVEGPDSHPWWEFYYLYQVEFFKPDASGNPDPSAMYDSVSGNLASQLFLGSVERGQVSTPVAAVMKNFGDQAIPLAEVWDDVAEWSDPVQAAGSGTGLLDYVQLSDSGLSQKYTIRFSSATDFEVRAEAYRDYSVGLHPSFDGASAWQGSTAADWTAPSGGLTIPAAAWQTGTAVNDEFVVYVTGNSTDSSWPADSASMVEVCGDDGSYAPDGNWRPIRARRTKLTSAVTIDATSKTLGVRHIESGNWTVGAKIWIGDGTNLDEGTIQSATATTITVEGLTATGHVYQAGARVGTTLPVQSLAATPWSTVDQDSGASQSPANRVYVADASKFQVGQTVVLQTLSTSPVQETATISAISTSAGYLDLSANLTQDYASGSIVYVQATGNAVVWFRVNATEISAEELKQLRVNVRT